MSAMIHGVREKFERFQRTSLRNVLSKLGGLKLIDALAAWIRSDQALSVVILAFQQCCNCNQVSRCAKLSSLLSEPVSDIREGESDTPLLFASVL